jgi:hypothetical protein
MAGIRLEWAQFGDFDSFDVIRSATSMAGIADIDLPSPMAIGLTTMYYVDTAVVVGTTYYYKVRVNRDGESVVSAEIEVVAMLGDKYWSNVVQLLHFDGADGSTSFPDSSSANLSPVAYGNAQITGEGIIGVGSLLLDGASYAMTSASSLLDLRGIDFTIQVWINATAVSNTPYLMHFYGSNPDRWVVYLDSSGHVSVYTATGGISISTSIAISLSTDTLIEVNMTAAGFLRVFINGVLGYSGTPFSGLGGGTSPRLEYGAAVAFNSNYFIGKLDEPRITRNVIRNTSNYTPLKIPWPNQ